MSLMPADQVKMWELRVAEAHANFQNRIPKWDWERVAAVEQAYLAARLKAVRERPLPYLQGLIILVGSKGTVVGHLDDWYEAATTQEWADNLTKYNTEQSRRELHTILKALDECPKSWARSAVGRHLRGQGKQAKTKYTGNGVFGDGSGWKGRELDQLLYTIADDTTTTGKVLIYVSDEYGYPDPDKWEAAQQTGANPFAMHQEERDVEFIRVMCSTLDHMGLGPEMQRPGPKAAPKPHKAKTFKPGDKVTATNARDLPMGAMLDNTDPKSVYQRRQFVKREMGSCFTFHTLVYVKRPDGTPGYWRYDQFGKASDLNGFIYKGIEPLQQYKTGW